MEPQRLSLLLEKYIHGLAAPEEVAELNDWYRVQAYQTSTFPDDEEAVKNRMLSRLQNSTVSKSKKTFYQWSAVVMLLVACVGSYWLLRPLPIKQLQISKNSHRTIVPGTDKAILTVAGGRRIVLNSAKAGTLITQAGSVISKTTNGELVYSTKGQQSEGVVYNTLTTPKGGQYNITLPDGTQVWLNAATSLTFPTQFNGGEREVKLTGEAYFEVAKNPHKPFKVNVAGRQQVTVLGTHFNIEAYPDDIEVKTTLLEGAVKLSTTRQDILLHPGEMVINPVSGALLKQQADEESTMAWKNGLFVFNDESIKSAMQKAARWYDVDIEYRDGMEKKRLGGVISKYKDITDLLDNITKSNGIHYKIEERRVILMK